MHDEVIIQYDIQILYCIPILRIQRHYVVCQIYIIYIEKKTILERELFI